MKILAIGDTHFKVNNIEMISLFIERLVQVANGTQPDIIVLLGDILHDHERLHTTPMNKAYEMIRLLRNVSPVFVLVGNHDMINHRQFLSDKHWMNAMKEWKDVYIVDKTLHLQFFGQSARTQFTFCPYVAPGRFVEALGSKEQLSYSGSDFRFDGLSSPIKLAGEKGCLIEHGGTYHNSFKEMCDTDPKVWMESDIIFAHQEFYGCKMGALTSEDGDKWALVWPNVVSGHIHSKQTPQKNIYYPGSSMQVAYGESEQNTIALVHLNESLVTEEINLQLPVKKIVYIETSEFGSYNLPETDDEIKLSISGTYEDFKAMKKTAKFKKMLKEGIKIVFRHTKDEETKSDQQNDVTDFEDILMGLIADEEDEDLNEIWKIVKGKK
jgi:DNA repair exonuclease SbcCD nuclease subunit